MDSSLCTLQEALIHFSKSTTPTDTCNVIAVVRKISTRTTTAGSHESRLWIEDGSLEETLMKVFYVAYGSELDRSLSVGNVLKFNRISPRFMDGHKSVTFHSKTANHEEDPAWQKIGHMNGNHFVSETNDDRWSSSTFIKMLESRGPSRGSGLPWQRTLSQVAPNQDQVSHVNARVVELKALPPQFGGARGCIAMLHDGNHAVPFLDQEGRFRAALAKARMSKCEIRLSSVKMVMRKGNHMLQPTGSTTARLLAGTKKPVEKPTHTDMLEVPQQINLMDRRRLKSPILDVLREGTSIFDGNDLKQPAAGLSPTSDYQVKVAVNNRTLTLQVTQRIMKTLCCDSDSFEVAQALREESHELEWLLHSTTVPLKALSVSIPVLGTSSSPKHASA